MGPVWGKQLCPISWNMDDTFHIYPRFDIQPSKVRKMETSYNYFKLCVNAMGSKQDHLHGMCWPGCNHFRLPNQFQTSFPIRISIEDLGSTYTYIQFFSIDNFMHWEPNDG